MALRWVQTPQEREANDKSVQPEDLFTSAPDQWRSPAVLWRRCEPDASAPPVCGILEETGRPSRMLRRSVAPLLFAITALTTGPISADDADDLAEIARLQATLQAKVPAALRVFSVDFGSGTTLLLRGSDSTPQQARIRSGSDWVELAPSGYVGTSSPTRASPSPSSRSSPGSAPSSRHAPLRRSKTRSRSRRTGSSSPKTLIDANPDGASGWW